MVRVGLHFGVAMKLAYQCSINHFCIVNLSHFGVQKRDKKHLEREPNSKSDDPLREVGQCPFGFVWWLLNTWKSSHWRRYRYPYRMGDVWHPYTHQTNPSQPVLADVPKAQTSPWLECCLADDVELLRLLLQVLGIGGALGMGKSNEIDGHRRYRQGVSWCFRTISITMIDKSSWNMQMGYVLPFIVAMCNP